MDIIENLSRKNIAAIPSSALLDLLISFWRGNRNELAKAFSKSTGEDLEQTIVESLPYCVLDVPDAVVEALVSRYTNDLQFYELMHSAVEIAFSQHLHGNPIARQHVIDGLSASDSIWHYDMHLSELLAAHGLPTTREALSSFICGYAS